MQGSVYETGTVFYGICGEGLGHYSRAVFLIPELLRYGYNVEIFSSRQAADLCRKRFKECKVHTIPGMKIHYKNNTLHLPKTTYNNCKSIIKSPSAFSLIHKRARRCDPVAIISDYEPLVSISGATLGIPVIAFDHQQVTTECKIENNVVSLFSMGLLRFSNGTTYPRPNSRIITSFFHPPLRKKRSSTKRMLIGPVLRPEILEQKEEQGEYILVYQTSHTMNQLQAVLDALPGEKKIYGAKAHSKGQMEKQFNEKEFIKDLAGCRFVIVNGGHTALSEALFFNKPVLCFPVKKQAEQEINGHYVAKLGFGECFHLEDLKQLPSFSHFLNNEKIYKSHIKEKKLFCGNQDLVKFVLERLRAHTKH